MITAIKAQSQFKNPQNQNHYNTCDKHNIPKSNKSRRQLGSKLLAFGFAGVVGGVLVVGV
jgi:hypothetical protein